MFFGFGEERMAYCVELGIIEMREEIGFSIDHGTHNRPTEQVTVKQEVKYLLVLHLSLSVELYHEVSC
jgi:hypothetical protein